MERNKFIVKENTSKNVDILRIQVFLLALLCRYQWAPQEYENIDSVPLPFSKVYSKDVSNSLKK